MYVMYLYAGVSMFLGLEAEKPFRVCSTLKKILIKENKTLSNFNLTIINRKLKSNFEFKYC